MEPSIRDVPLDLVRIASFATPEEAEIVRVALEQEGIPACLEGTATTGNLWHLGNAVGGVRLLVFREQAERAADIVENRRTRQVTQRYLQGKRHCPHCGAAAEPSFSICWSCSRDMDEESDGSTASGTDVGDVGGEYQSGEEALDETAGSSAEPTVSSEYPETEAGDLIAKRAWRSAALGLVFFCPVPVLSLYSLWLLVSLSVTGRPLSRPGQRHWLFALIINLVVVSALLLAYRSMLR